MIAVARIFGAPVIDAGGKSAAKMLASETDRSTSASTVEVSCHTRGYRSGAHRLGTRTLPLARDATEVVPHDVDDHHVLGAVLLRSD